MNKNLITKTSIIIFTMGISFAGLNFVLAAGSVDCPEAGNRSNSCIVNPKYCREDPVTPSGCRSQGCSRVVNEPKRFNNNSYMGEYSFVTGMNENELKSYKNFIDYFDLPGLGDANKARKIQETINILHQTMNNCGPVCEDGRFGNETIRQLNNCLPCGGNKEKGAKIMSGKLACSDGYSMDENFCCKKAQTECYVPILKINGNEDIDTFSTGELQVEVDYSNNDGDIDFDLENIVVDGAEIVTYPSLNNKVVTFPISPVEGATHITLFFDENFATLTGGSLTGGLKCPQISKDLFRCDNPPVGGRCLGTGEFNNNGCCKKCGENQKVVNNDCVCDELSLKCKSGEKPDLESCKCVCDPSTACCGIKLNTVVPFIGDCIEMTTMNDTHDPQNLNTSNVNQLNAFPFLMMGLSKILVTVILIFSFLIVIVAGLMMVTGVYDEGNYKKGMTWIKNVIVALILLGSSGLILKLINPSFFGG